MFPKRSATCALLILVSHFSIAQSVHKGHLITSLGAGVGSLTVSNIPDSISTSHTTAGSVTFRFAYALSDRWSLGMHYDRIGTDRSGNTTDLLRFTAFLAQVTYRPWIGARAALETNIAVGPSLMALKPFSQDLPLRGQRSAINIGVRYLHMVGKTLGAFVSLDHVACAAMNVTDYNGDAIADKNGDRVVLDWNSQRFDAGLFVRF